MHLSSVPWLHPFAPAKLLLSALALNGRINSHRSIKCPNQVLCLWPGRNTQHPGDEWGLLLGPTSCLCCRPSKQALAILDHLNRRERKSVLITLLLTPQICPDLPSVGQTQAMGRGMAKAEPMTALGPSLALSRRILPCLLRCLLRRGSGRVRQGDLAHRIPFTRSSIDLHFRCPRRTVP